MSTELRIEYGGCSEIGLVRKENQDSFGVFPEGDTPGSGAGVHLFVVADGMGGHTGGGEASKIAVDVIRSSFQNSPRASIPQIMKKAFDLANEAIYRESLQLFPPAIMGSTCTALAIADKSAYIAHVGDSRAYRVTASGIEQLTEDHSVVGELQRRGLIDRRTALSHPERSQITRALGVKPSVAVDVIEEIPIKGSETFLLCTDYISNVITDAEIRDTILSHNPQDAARALVDLALSRGGEDNVTAQVVRVQEAASGDSGSDGVLQRGED